VPLPRKPFFDSSSSDLSYLVDQAGVDFIKVVLDGRHAGPTCACNETQRRLERYLS
jgi:hypothetical protein